LYSSGREWKTLAGGDVFATETDWEIHTAADLERIHRRGYASEIDEHEEGTAAIAAPILDASGVALAAVSVGAPSFRFGPTERQRAVGPLLDAATAIAADLGVASPSQEAVVHER